MTLREDFVARSTDYQALTLGEFMERLEIVIVTLWLSGMVVRTGLYL
ncbi:MAG: hypothetical protein ACOY94_07600 [Bacillota bacterium]